MAQETLTLRTMNNGGIIEAVDAALAKIAENIADINTPPTSPAGGINPAIYPAPPQQWLAQWKDHQGEHLAIIDPGNLLADMVQNGFQRVMPGVE